MMSIDHEILQRLKAFKKETSMTNTHKRLKDKMMTQEILN
jgi:hypothetical protein